MSEIGDSYGQPSFALRTNTVRLAITETGGHMAPVEFRLGRRWVAPLSIAPWWKEDTGQPPILQVLRGDFFCLPFGANAGTKHGIHGRTANSRWTLTEHGAHSLRLRQNQRPGVVEKFIELRPGESAIYQRHVLTGMSGRMCPGHHAMLHFKSEGLISTSPIIHGQVNPEPGEQPAQGGYSSLNQGAIFDSLGFVSRADGGTADLSRYPAREGYEDLALVAADPALPFAWTAVVYPAARHVWIAFKNPRLLRSTVLWHSNGGRHYPPWNGRHRHVLGLEEVTAYFAEGITASAKANSLNRRGIPTALTLSARRPTIIPYIMAMAPVPANFTHVATVERTAPSHVEIIDRAGHRAALAVNLDFLG